jgi:hypothetical protein
MEPSTIVDCTTDEWTVTGQGLGVGSGNRRWFYK